MFFNSTKNQKKTNSNSKQRGTGESVTPGALMTDPSNWKFLIAGIDTLDFGLFVNWKQWNELEKDLILGKAKALSKRKGVLGKGLLENTVINLTGKAPMYQYGLIKPEYRFWIASRKESAEYPNVFVSPTAKSLWTFGFKGTFELIANEIKALGGVINEHRLSRVDMCCDYYVPKGLNYEWLENYRVSRAHKTSNHKSGSDLQTYYVAPGGAGIQARIYDKSAQIEHSQNLWMRDLWPHPYESNVWRVEFQIRRGTLREFETNTVTDLANNATGLWTYLTTDWLSFRNRDDTNTTRRTFTSFWQAVREASKHFDGFATVKRSPIDGEQSMDQCLLQIMGFIKSYAAKKSLTHLDSALRALRQDLKTRTTREEFKADVTVRAISLGISLNDREAKS